jgi:acyl-CoA synthetase (AMP-forming)/AMP-acid ligase II
MPPLLDRISDYVEWYAERSPSAEALVLDSCRIDYAQLASEVRALSSAMLAAGIKAGDRIATLATPHPDFFIIFLAAVSIGAIWVGLNPRYQRDELEYVLRDSRPCIVFSRTKIGNRDYSEDIGLLQQVLPSARWVVLGGDALCANGTSHAEFIASGATTSTASLRLARTAVRPQDPALIVYTSGSTGSPKGALLAHRGLAVCCRVQHRYWGTTPLRTLNFFPINHIACVGDIACFTLVGGGCSVFQEQFSPAECLSGIARERISLWLGVPTTFLLSLRDSNFELTDLSSVQKIAWSGAAASAELVDSLLGLGKWLGTSYGLTETVGSVTFTDAGASRNTLIKTVGKPAPEYFVRIVDAAERPVEAAEVGEVQIRGDSMLIGYWEQAAATREAFKAEWFKTGDLARWSDDGNVELVGRKQEVFKSGGYNIYPREIEIALERHRAVRLAAVVAVPDAVFGEVGHAFVIPQPEATIAPEELDLHCRQCLANYKVPKGFTVLLDAPLLPIGKIDKRALAARVSASAPG